MFKHAITCLFVLSITACGTADDAASENADSTPANENTDPATTGQTPSEATRVLIETSLGEITIELDAANAPNTVANFLSYVDDGFYDGSDGNGQTTFHRVISGFMIQGGGFTADMKQKDTKPPIANESNNGLKNDAYTVAMARTSVPDSATSQFFINVANNDFRGI